MNGVTSTKKALTNVIRYSKQKLKSTPSNRLSGICTCGGTLTIILTKTTSTTSHCSYVMENGFTTFDVSEQLIENMVYQVSMLDLERPPANKLRKIIFKDNSGLTTEEKLRIVGTMVGKQKLTETEIYDAMLYLHDAGEKITIKKIAESLECSTRTVHRNMSVELKKEKQLLNQEL